MSNRKRLKTHRGRTVVVPGVTLSLGLGIAALGCGPSAAADTTVVDLLTAANIRIDGTGISTGTCQAGDESGSSVAGAGDVNGDGLSDVIIGAPGAVNSSCDHSGSSYVVFGRGSLGTVDLANLGAGGFRIDGASWKDRSGYSVAGAGDINGDGRDDVIVGAPWAGRVEGDLWPGASYVVFGKTGTEPVDLAHLGRGGFRIDGASWKDRSGYSVAGAGDVNGDGLNDVVVGTSRTDYGVGSAYVVFGKRGTRRVDLHHLHGAGFRIVTEDSDTDFSEPPYGGNTVVVGAAGDVNGDGRPDVTIGAPRVVHNGRTRSYVVFGKTGTAGVDLEHLGMAGFRIDGAVGDAIGSSVAGTGDVNGDGLADVIIGAPWADHNGRKSSGSSYVVFGKTGTARVDLAHLGMAGFRVDGAAGDASGTSTIGAGDVSGWSVAGVGDVNGDGRADMIIGAPWADNNGRLNSGSSYVVLGQAATVKMPRQITAKGATVLLKKTEVTSAGQKATSTVTWSTKKPATGTKKKYATVTTTRSGQVTIKTTGRAKRLYVKLRMKAPAMAAYAPYRFKAKWTVTQ